MKAAPAKPPQKIVKEVTYNATMSSGDKIALVSNLHTMLASGIPILETVDSLLEDSKGGTKKLLETMRQDLGQGRHIYATFAKFPKIFDKVTISIIKASEESGTLDTALEDLQSNIKKEIELVKKNVQRSSNNQNGWYSELFQSS